MGDKEKMILHWYKLVKYGGWGVLGVMPLVANELEHFVEFINIIVISLKKCVT